VTIGHAPSLILGREETEALTSVCLGEVSPPKACCERQGEGGPGEDRTAIPGSNDWCQASGGDIRDGSSAIVYNNEGEDARCCL